MTIQHRIWGRRTEASWERGVVMACFMVICPMLTILPTVALEFHGGSIGRTIAQLLAQPIAFFSQYLPRTTLDAFLVYMGWTAFQALLYTVLPGRVAQGQRTPAGKVLDYKINGLGAMGVTLAVFACLVGTGNINPSWVAANWSSLVMVANVYGFILGLAAPVKATQWPTTPADSKFSGSFFYDLYMGIELNPRFGELWDIKLFHIGRTGMMTWLMVDLCFTAYQYQHYGFITNAILIVDVLHALYVVDFFVNESWYLKTIDIEHDHFGFYFAWGSAAFLPVVYTLQAQYLARYPTQLQSWQENAIVLVGVCGYFIFRSANDQKLKARQSPDTYQIWGQVPAFIKCYYKTSNNILHESSLLISGWWGVVRHANYLGDLLLSFAACAACNTNLVLPWTYAIFMTTLLVHRCIRDEQRCSAKYGKYWAEYCRRVPWRIIPGVF